MSNGIIDFYNGRMNGGKTAHLIMDAFATEEGGTARAIIAKPKLDSKAGDRLSSRIGLSAAVDILFEEDDVPSERIAQATLIGKRCLKAVLIDEAQFLSTEQVDDLARYANEHPQIDVKAYGLRTDFTMQLFPGSKRLFEVADSVTLDAKCVCGSPNPLINARLVNGVFAFSGNQVAIDGEEMTTYKTLCLSCIAPEVEAAYERGDDISSSILSIVGLKSALTTTDKQT
jgi:thymidine kinase